MAKMKENYIVTVERDSKNPVHPDPYGFWFGSEAIEEEAEKTAIGIWEIIQNMDTPFDSYYLRVRDRSTTKREILWENGAKVVTRPVPPSKPASPSKTADDDDKAALRKQLEDIMNKLNGMG